MRCKARPSTVYQVDGPLPNLSTWLSPQVPLRGGCCEPNSAGIELNGMHSTGAQSGVAVSEAEVRACAKT